jgi:hypothetical protein
MGLSQERNTCPLNAVRWFCLGTDGCPLLPRDLITFLSLLSQCLLLLCQQHESDGVAQLLPPVC